MGMAWSSAVLDLLVLFAAAFAASAAAEEEARTELGVERGVEKGKEERASRRSAKRKGRRKEGSAPLPLFSTFFPMLVVSAATFRISDFALGCKIRRPVQRRIWARARETKDV